MALVIPPGFAHVAVQMRHDLDPDPWYVTWGVDVTGLGGDVEAIAWHNMEGFAHAFAATISPTINVTGCEVVLGQDGGEPVRAFVAPRGPLTGTANDDRLPQNCALLVRKNTAVGGRRSRGRIFVPGVLAEVAVSPVGIISSGGLTSYQSYATQLLTNINTEDVAGNTPATPMFLLHSEGISLVPAPTEITTLTVDNVISTQRRRLR